MIRLRVPGSLNYRSVALRVVSEACRMAQGREDEQDAAYDGGEFEAQAVSAFGEAFNNVAIHSFRGLPPGSVDIEISWTPEQMVIQMTDSGLSFDPDTVEPPALDELPEGGMGIFIMRSFMDEVVYKAGPPNVLQLIKRRGGEEEERGLDDVPVSSGAPDPIPPVEEPVTAGSPMPPRPLQEDRTSIEARVVGGSRRT